MKKQQPSKGTKGKDRWFWIMVTVFAVILLGSVLHHHMQTSAQNKTFKETQSWLQGVMSEVAVKVPNGEHVSEAYCVRSSVKYGQGGRSCFTDESLLYPIQENQFDSYMSKVQMTLSAGLGTSMKNLGRDSLTQTIGSYAFIHRGLSCYVTYYGLQNQSTFSYLEKISNFSNGLRVSVECSGPAMADYFPNRD